MWKRGRSANAAHRARSSVAWLCGLAIGGQAVFGIAIEHGLPTLRDPEYGHRETRLRKLVARHDGAPLCVAFGSSRLAEGLRPGVIDSTRSVIFNFGLIGAGPVMQRLALDRVLRAGITPSLVLVEFWPPYLLTSNCQPEQERLERTRLNSADDAVIAHYWGSTAGISEKTRRYYSHRFTLLNLSVPNWLPFQNRREFYWTPLDEFGWLPGKPSDAAGRPSRLEQSRLYYAPVLQSQTFDPVGTQAFEDLFAICRERGIEVGVIWLPESSEFRNWYSMSAERLARERFAEFGKGNGARMIDARTWIDDERLNDGFHLDPDGASAFTFRLEAELACRSPKEAGP